MLTVIKTHQGLIVASNGINSHYLVDEIMGQQHELSEQAAIEMLYPVTWDEDDITRITSSINILTVHKDHPGLLAVKKDYQLRGKPVQLCLTPEYEVTSTKSSTDWCVWYGDRLIIMTKEWFCDVVIDYHFRSLATAVDVNSRVDGNLKFNDCGYWHIVF